LLQSYHHNNQSLFAICDALLLPLHASWLQESVTNTGITLVVVVAVAIAGSGSGNGSCGGSAVYATHIFNFWKPLF
jgi:hypothetical protein